MFRCDFFFITNNEFQKNAQKVEIIFTNNNN